MEVTLKYNKKKAYFNVLQIAFIAPLDDDNGTIIYLSGDEDGVQISEDYTEVKRLLEYELSSLYENKTVRMNESGTW